MILISIGLVKELRANPALLGGGEIPSPASLTGLNIVPPHQLLAGVTRNSDSGTSAKHAGENVSSNRQNGAVVKEIQYWLKTLGYSPGPINGLLTEQTASAIEAYQKSSGVSIDGMPSATLLKNLRSPSTVARRSSPQNGGVPANGGRLTVQTEMLREIQRILTDLGYAPGAADGVMGKRTRLAIYEYQRGAGLRVDGVASPELLASLREHHTGHVTPAQNTTALNSMEIREIQRRLNELGYASIPSDGRINEETESAIYAYQRESGLTADGRPSKSLLISLRSLARDGATNNSAASQRVIKVPMSSSLRRSDKTLYYECERQVNVSRKSEGLPSVRLVSQQELQRDAQEENRRMILDEYKHHATSGGTAGAGVPAGKTYLEAMQNQSDMLIARQMARGQERLNMFSDAQIKAEERASATAEIKICVVSNRK